MTDLRAALRERLRGPRQHGSGAEGLTGPGMAGRVLGGRHAAPDRPGGAAQHGAQVRFGRRWLFCCSLPRCARALSGANMRLPFRVSVVDIALRVFAFGANGSRGSMWVCISPATCCQLRLAVTG